MAKTQVCRKIKKDGKLARGPFQRGNLVELLFERVCLHSYVMLMQRNGSANDLPVTKKSFSTSSCLPFMLKIPESPTNIHANCAKLESSGETI